MLRKKIQVKSQISWSSFLAEKIARLLLCIPHLSFLLFFPFHWSIPFPLTISSISLHVSVISVKHHSVERATIYTTNTKPRKLSVLVLLLLAQLLSSKMHWSYLHLHAAVEECQGALCALNMLEYSTRDVRAGRSSRTMSQRWSVPYIFVVITLITMWVTRIVFFSSAEWSPFCWRLARDVRSFEFSS